MISKLLKGFGVGLGIMIVLLLMTLNKGAWAQHGGGHGEEPPPEQLPPPEAPKEDKITWRTDDFSKAFTIAYEEKKLLFLYLFFKPEDDFSIKYDKVLSKYSSERLIFVELYVRTDSKGEISDEKIKDLFKKNNLTKGNIALILDPYGNLIDKLPVSNSSAPIVAAIDKAGKKWTEIEKDLTGKWNKIKKLRTDLIKELNSLVKNNWQGYEAVLNAQKELDKLSKPFADKYKEIITNYMAIDQEKRNTNKTIKQLEDLAAECEDLPISATIKETIAKMKKGELPQID